jgi:hypothetical protein
VYPREKEDRNQEEKASSQSKNKANSMPEASCHGEDNKLEGKVPVAGKAGLG